MLLIALYIATIPAANLLIEHVGFDCRPCLIPVAPGIYAPSGVLMIGLALVLRDLVQRLYGPTVAIYSIIIGTAVSLLIAPPALAIASGSAFLISELADMGVYTPLRKKRLPLAVLASGAVGAVVDSAVFLWIAFGSLDFLLGQVIGKLMMVALAAAALACRSASDTDRSRRSP